MYAEPATPMPPLFVTCKLLPATDVKFASPETKIPFLAYRSWPTPRPP